MVQILPETPDSQKDHICQSLLFKSPSVIPVLGQIDHQEATDRSRVSLYTPCRAASL